MFLPELNERLDPTFAPRFVEQEVRAQLKGKAQKFVDKLVLVRLRDGDFRLVVVHLEFESRPRGIARRMFDYYCLIKDIDPAKLFPDLFPLSANELTTEPITARRKKVPFDITALVVYVGNEVPKVYDRYEVDAFGTSHRYVFNTYIVRDQNEADLKANPNPFAIVVLATKYVNATTADSAARLSLKEQIYKFAIEIGIERGMERKKIDSLLVFIDELLHLPPDLDKVFNTSIAKFQPATTSMYVTKVSFGLAEAILKEQIGFTSAELQAQLAEQKTAQREAVAKNVVRLYTQKQMPVNEIADLLELTPQYVRAVLRKANAL